jgi:hypothetical protein
VHILVLEKSTALPGTSSIEPIEMSDEMRYSEVSVDNNKKDRAEAILHAD